MKRLRYKPNQRQKRGAVSNVTSECGGKRGCSVTITLLYDSVPASVSMGLLPKRDDIQAILPMAYATVDTVAKKAG